MAILEAIKAAFQVLLEWWGKLPEGTKRKIVDGVVTAMREVFRIFYQRWQQRRAQRDQGE